MHAHACNQLALSEMWEIQERIIGGGMMHESNHRGLWQVSENACAIMGHTRTYQDRHQLLRLAIPWSSVVWWSHAIILDSWMFVLEWGKTVIKQFMWQATHVDKNKLPMYIFPWVVLSRKISPGTWFGLLAGKWSPTSDSTWKNRRPMWSTSVAKAV